MLLQSLVRFKRNQRGIAAVEFALTLPVMALLFFGMLEASDLLTVKRRVANAANSLVDLVTQEPSIEMAEVNDSIAGVTRMLEPTNSSLLSVQIVSLIKGPNPDDPVTVHWSLDDQGGEPYAPGSVYLGLGDDANVRNEASLMVVEMTYQYASGLTSKVFTTPHTFSQKAKRWPRKSSRVQLCQTSDPATCTS